MLISIIVAIGKNNVIGAGNKLLWSLPADMKHFKELTVGKTVIMGRKTFESIGKALPGRKNIIISRSDYHAPGCVAVSSIDEALKAAKGHEEVMIIGGASIYGQFLPIAKRMYITYVDAEINGDAFFPEFNKSDWKETFREAHKKDDNNEYDYTFVTLERKS
jgi:dihydrofolate reductase